MSVGPALTQTTRRASPVLGRPEATAFAVRHHFVLVLLWVLVPALAAVGLARQASIYQVVVASLLLMALAFVGMSARSRNLAAGAVTVGLVVAAGTLVTYMEGTAESQFAFFLAIIAVSFYNEWLLLVLSFLYVAAFHLIAGFIVPGDALTRSPAVADPVGWASVHLGLTLVLVLLLVAGRWLATKANAGPAGTEEGYRLSFEKAPIGMAVLAPSGEFLHVNEALAAILGHDQSKLIGASVRSVVHADDLGELDRAWEEMGNGAAGSATAWLRCVTVKGQAIWGRVSLSPVEWAANRPVILLHIEDATKTHQDQRRLEHLIEGKDEFVAAIGDEIREPLSTVLELASHADGVNPDLKLIVRRIETHAREVASIVDDLVVSARATTKPVSVVARSVDAGLVCRKTLERIPGADGIPVVIGATALWADPDLTRQILHGLVTNAIRYGGPSIELKTTGSGPDTVIQVMDDGPEIPVSERERIFKGDLRSGRPVTRPAAVGLSLTVGRHLARQMGGDIAYRRCEDGRNLFELRLPSERLTEIHNARTELEAERLGITA